MNNGDFCFSVRQFQTLQLCKLIMIYEYENGFSFDFGMVEFLTEDKH